MRKMVLMIVALLLCSMTTNAIPVRPGQWSTLTLADGTTVRAELRGSEYGTWYQDAQGQCYVQQGDCYVRIEEATADTRRQSMPAARRSRRAFNTSTENGLGAFGKNSKGAMYSIGEYTIPVIMVEFEDTKFRTEHTQELFQNYLTQEGFQYHNPHTNKTVGVGSIRDFFVSQSEGMFKPNFKVLGKVTLDKSYKYYGQHAPNDMLNDWHADEMVVDAIKIAAAQLGVDFKQYVVQPKDSYHEEGIPLVCFLYAGEAESNHANKNAEDYQPDLLWPHELDIDKDIELPGGVTVNLNSYFIGNELAKDGKSLAGIGTFVHELGHALGLPDWYCTDPSLRYHGDDAFGHWSTMDSGSYVGDSWTPMGYTAYERSYMGWLDIPTITKSGHVKLGKPYEKNYCAVFFCEDDNEEDTEYFIIESRYPSTWYPKATEKVFEDDDIRYGSGLMLSRFAFDEDEWLDDGPNNEKDAKRAMMITADGEPLNRSAFQDELFGNGVSTISGKKFLSGIAWDVTISNITKNSDGSIEFDLDLGTTGIEELKNGRIEELKSSDAWYDLQGRRLQGQPTQKGVYLYKGKKVIK